MTNERYLEILRARVHAVQTKTAEARANIDWYFDTRSSRPSTTTPQQLSDWDNRAAIGIGPKVRDLINAVERLEEHTGNNTEANWASRAFGSVTGLTGGHPDNPAAIRQDPSWTSATSALQAAHNEIYTWQTTPAFQYDRLNASWHTRVRASTRRFLSSGEAGRIIGSNITGIVQGATGSTESTNQAQQKAALRQQYQQQNQNQNQHNHENEEDDWGLFMFGILGTATLILGSGIALGVLEKRRAPKRNPLRRKLRAHRRRIRS